MPKSSDGADGTIGAEKSARPSAAVRLLRTMDASVSNS